MCSNGMGDGQGFGFGCRHISVSCRSKGVARSVQGDKRSRRIGGGMRNVRVTGLRVIAVTLLEVAYSSFSSRPVVNGVHVPGYGRCSELLPNGKGDAL